MYSEISCRKVKVRKEHHCEWCNEKIGKGEIVMRRVYIFEGCFNDNRMHLECFDAMDRSKWDLVSEGWVAGTVGRGEVLS